MFKNVLVPLDGSSESDRIVAELKRLLGRQDLGVTLLRVLDPLRHHGSDREERDEREPHPTLRVGSARMHLKRIKDELASEGVEATTRVIMGDPASVIVRRAASLPDSLVAMGTHGRTGPARWVLGSVAERVLRNCARPLLLINASETQNRPPGVLFRRILLPLDGSETAAGILPLIKELAAFYMSEVVLLRVAPLLAPVAAPYPVGPMTPPMSLADVKASLEPIVKELAEAGINARALATAGDPAREILEAIESEEIDLVAMTTHGWTGLDRWAFGSVAEKVLRHCPRPLLVQRVASFVPEDEHELGEEAKEQSAAS